MAEHRALGVAGAVAGVVYRGGWRVELAVVILKQAYKVVATEIFRRMTCCDDASVRRGDLRDSGRCIHMLVVSTPACLILIACCPAPCTLSARAREIDVALLPCL